MTRSLLTLAANHYGRGRLLARFSHGPAAVSHWHAGDALVRYAGRAQAEAEAAAYEGLGRLTGLWEARAARRQSAARAG